AGWHCSGCPLASLFAVDKGLLALPIALGRLWVRQRLEERMVKLVERRVEARVLEPLRMTERHGITRQAHRFVLEFAGERGGSVEKCVAARGYRHRIVFAAGCGPRVVHGARSLLLQQSR